MRKRSLALLLLAACNDSMSSALVVPDMGPVAPPFDVNCTVADPSAEAKLAAGPQPDGSVILIGGRRITPNGKLLDVGGFPLAFRVLPPPNGRYAVVTDGSYGTEALRLIDLQASDPKAAVVAHADYNDDTNTAHDPALFYGLALTRDGKRLYVSDGGYDPVGDGTPQVMHYNVVEVYDLAPPNMTRNDALTIKLFFNPELFTDGSANSRLPAGLTLSADEKTLYVACQNDDTLAIVDVSQGATYGTEIGRATTPGAGATPYDVALDEAGHTAWLSLWGGGGLVPVDVSDRTRPLAAMTVLATGGASEAAVFTPGLGGPGAIWVANSNSDTVTRVDSSSHLTTELAIGDGTASTLGRMPNNLLVDSKTNRLYVANAGDNSVSVFDTTTLAQKGRIPTAWYPTAVATLADGSVVIASAKGLGLGPSDRRPQNGTYMTGVLQIVPPPSDADLAAGDAQVTANNHRPAAYQPAISCPPTGEKRFPLPPDVGSPTPIEHVFLVVRENKTYDAYLGDVATANGSPALAIFGGDHTPNLHALVAQFTSLDNFYDNSEQSIQGHEWTTAVANDYTEKAWSSTWDRAYRPLGAFGSGPEEKLSVPGGDTIWTHLDKAHVAYHNYGEITNAQTAAHTFDESYPGLVFNLATSDVQKIEYVIENLSDPNLPVEPFVYIGLPNDHTYGTAHGRQTPQSMIADNDEATGRFIDALSHSPLWPTSIVFIVEDDPGDTADHVEMHRSPCVVISPWVKHAYLSSVNHDFPALTGTLMRLLRLGPMYQGDAQAALMSDVFATTMDLTPYTFIPRKIPLATNSDDAPMSDESSRIDWSHPDSAPLGRILWKAMKGRHAEPPWGPTDSPVPRGLREGDGDDD